MPSDLQLIDDELHMLSFEFKQHVDNLIRTRTVNTDQALLEILRMNPHRPLIDGPQCWQRMLTAFFQAAAAGAPEKTEDARAAMRRAKKLTEEIRQGARSLARKLRARAALFNAHDLSRPADFHPVDLLREASYIADQHADSQSNIAGRFRLNIAHELDELDRRFDLMSWPQTADLIDALANLQDPEDLPTPFDDALHAATECREASVRDYWRALDIHLFDICLHHEVNTDLSDQNVVDLTSAILGHPPGCTVENRAKFRRSNTMQHRPDNSPR